MNSLTREAGPAVKGNGFMHSLQLWKLYKVLPVEWRGRMNDPWPYLMFALDCFIKITPFRKALSSHKIVTNPKEF